MRLRILISGLAALGAAVVLATIPVLAHGSSRSQPACTIVGTPGADAINGTQGRDVICTGRGADVIFGAGGNDVIRAGRGADVVQGSSGSDTMKGGPGRDVFYAWDGTRDRITGGTGFDRAPRRDIGIDVIHGVESFD